MVPTTLAASDFDPITSKLLDSIEDGVVVYDLKFRYQLFNRFMERLSGLRAEEVLGRCAFDLFPHLREHGIDKLLERARDGETVRSPETPYHIPATNRRGWVVSHYSPVIGRDGICVGVIGIIREITQRRRMEEAVLQSERWFRSITENASEMVLVLDGRGMTTYANPPASRFIGGGPRNLTGDPVGIPIFEVVHPDDLAAVRDAFARVVALEGALVPVEFRCRRYDGTWRTVSVSARNLLDEAAVCGVVIHARDVSDQRALETQFLHAQRMDAVGRLAGGIAHDFNNLLSVIQGNASFALENQRKGEPSEDELREISSAADRGAALTRQLLAFSRQQPQVMEELCPNGVIRDVERLLARVAGDEVALVTELAPQVGAVRADRGQLEQVIVNLVANARDAMPKGGTVYVRTLQEQVHERMTRIQPESAPGEYVVISVTDTGEGMTPEVRARIFEPFFTTKERGKGTGLGLPTVYGIVKQCGGFVGVESEIGVGSAFRVYLPRVGTVPELTASN